MMTDPSALPSRAFITGISGFAGSHLAETCVRKGMSVSGLVRGSPEERPNLAAVGNAATFYSGDLLDEDGLGRILADARPTILFHLAAATGSRASEQDLLETNILGTINLMARAGALREPPRFLLASSSAVYGHVADPERPIDESTPLAPVSIYGFSKAAQDSLCGRLAATFGFDIVRARAFNHTGPRESDAFVASSIARQIALIEAGRAPPRLRVGKLDSIRDFCDVRDIAEGYYLAAARGKAGEVYNLASGRPAAVAELVRILVGLSPVEIAIEQDESRFRPSDLACQIGDAGKADRELGWQPRRRLEETLRDLLDEWRRCVREGMV